MRESLTRECRVFARYLTDHDAPDSVIAKYLDYHERFPNQRSTVFDEALVRAALASAALRPCADAYTAAFRKNAALRRKLVLTLSLLESTPTASDWLDTPRSSSSAAALLRIVVGVAASAACLVAGVTVFEPVRLWCALTGGRDSA
jgi:hypothetical protein